LRYESQPPPPPYFEKKEKKNYSSSSRFLCSFLEKTYGLSVYYPAENFWRITFPLQEREEEEIVVVLTRRERGLFRSQDPYENHEFHRSESEEYPLKIKGQKLLSSYSFFKSL